MCWLCSFLRGLRYAEYLVSGVIPGRSCPYENDPEVQPCSYSFCSPAHTHIYTDTHQQGQTRQVYCEWFRLQLFSIHDSWLPCRAWMGNDSLCMMMCNTHDMLDVLYYQLKQGAVHGLECLTLTWDFVLVHHQHDDVNFGCDCFSFPQQKCVSYAWK